VSGKIKKLKMNKRLRVVLYGKSVILGTVGASLARYPDLEVVILSPPLPGAMELATLSPDVILFDNDRGRPEALFALLKDSPSLLLIGVNPENDQMLMWSSGQSSVLCTEDIMQTITGLPG
jgi:hypothetical protein